MKRKAKSTVIPAATLLAFGYHDIPKGSLSDEYPTAREVKIPEPGAWVKCSYRHNDHVGMVLRVDDPRAWAGTIAFPEDEPDPVKVREHIARCKAEGGLRAGRVPVLWSFGKTFWDETSSLREV